jgi:hypothetical protein
MEARAGKSPTAHVLVIANETVGGQKLLEAIERRAAQGPIRCTVICPQNQPRKGFVIYDDSVRSAAQVRLDLTLARLRELGIDARGEVMDPDPYLATEDAFRLYGADEVIISTHPYPRSGWLRRDLVQRIRNFTKVPVEHVIVDLSKEPTKHVIVAANQTIGGRVLIETLNRRASQSPHRFTVICPQDSADPDAAAGARKRLDQTLTELRAAGLTVAGYVAHPDPLTAIENAHQSDPADEIIVSTLPSVKSKWLRGDVINGARKATGVAVEHVVGEPAGNAAAPAQSPVS